MFIVIGGFFAIFAQNYPMGSAVRMGPAYFPTMLGWILVGIGAIVFLRSFFMHGGEAPEFAPDGLRGEFFCCRPRMGTGARPQADTRRCPPLSITKGYTQCHLKIC